MPKLPTFEQEIIPLYPVVEQLNDSNGVIPYTLEDTPYVDPERRINVARLARNYGNLLGPTDGVGEDFDLLLDVAEKDFGNASPSTIRTGLYISPCDPRYNSSTTEQLMRVGNIMGENVLWGVVFSTEQFKAVGWSARGLTDKAMANARGANAQAKDRPEAEAKIGRSAGHIMETYIPQMEKLDGHLDTFGKKIIKPLNSGRNSEWQAHYKAKDLDVKFRIFHADMHDVLETASINLNIGSIALKAAHRALTSKLTRRGSAREQNLALATYLDLSGGYVKARRKKLERAILYCRENLANFQPFLDAKAQAEAKTKVA